MDKGNELLTAVKEIGKCLDGRMDQSISNALAAFEGIAHILDTKTSSLKRVFVIVVLSRR